MALYNNSSENMSRHVLFSLTKIEVATFHLYFLSLNCCCHQRCTFFFIIEECNKTE